ncbi:MAG: efflux RND transporter periplasmic adaptor subunit [bacterium]|nr:efflux RND transporter periplasmic adaptor subunit [bacterium]
MVDSEVMQLTVGNFTFWNWKYFFIIIALSALGGYVYFWGQGNSSGDKFIVTSGDFIQKVSISGTVTATKNANLGFTANGRISDTYVKVGQRVAEGTILAEIENDELIATIAQKRASLAQAEANLASLRAGTRPEEVAVASIGVTNATSALIDAIQNAYTYSDDSIHNKADAIFSNPRTDPKISFTIANANLKTEVERDRVVVEQALMNWDSLVSRLNGDNAYDSAKQSQTYLTQVASFLAGANLAINQGVSDQTTSASTISSYGTILATARANINVVTASLTSGITSLDSARSNLTLKQAGPTDEALSAQEAAVSVAKADVSSTQAKLAATRVIAPFGGVVTRMDAKVGEIVSPATSLISMHSDGIFGIETYVPEVAIARIAPGNYATTTLDAYGQSLLFASTVVAVDPAETLRDGVPTYKTTIAFIKPDSRIRSGMTANVIIETGVLQNAIVIPSGAIVQNGGVSYVSVVKNDAVESRTITTGPSPALGQAHVLSGLSDGDVILLTPVL